MPKSGTFLSPWDVKKSLLVLIEVTMQNILTPLRPFVKVRLSWEVVGVENKKMEKKERDKKQG